MLRHCRILVLQLVISALLAVPACSPSERTPGSTESTRVPVGHAVLEGQQPEANTISSENPTLPRELRLRNTRRLTFEGSNAEAYFSPDGQRLIFQSQRGDLAGDQIFIMDLPSGETRMVSTGQGLCTCSYFIPGGGILYSSTHHHAPECPPKPSGQGYAWPLYPSYDIFVANEDGTQLRQLTNSLGYDAEATVSPDGEWIIFTSLREGELNLYRMRTDGTDLRQVTHRKGYEGGAFFFPDGTRIVYRSHYPRSFEEMATYDAVLTEAVLHPMNLELYVMDLDSGEETQVTDNGKVNFSPFPHPSGEKLIFASNMDGLHPGDFNLYLVNIDGTGLEQVTFHPGFDNFPMFSPDGRYLVWCSSRLGTGRHGIDLYLSEWVED